MIERRQSTRISITGSVTLAVAKEEFPAKLMNISAEGVQVELSGTAMALLIEHKNPDGSWPMMHMAFGKLAPDRARFPAGINCELAFQRRISQKIYIAGLSFVMPDGATKDTMHAMVQALLLKQQKKSGH
jgi:c-di-GMP-binding flagellar brake protein YcgR